MNAWHAYKEMQNRSEPNFKNCGRHKKHKDAVSFSYYLPIPYFYKTEPQGQTLDIY